MMFRSLIPWGEKPMSVPTDRFSPLLSRFENEMEELRERFFGSDGGWLTLEGGFVPRADVVETEKDFGVTIDLPGLKPEDVHVELRNGELWITGERKEEKEEKGKTFHRIERHHGEFRRVLRLPTTVEQDKVDAKFKDGVLMVTVPKTEEAKPKSIEVKG